MMRCAIRFEVLACVSSMNPWCQVLRGNRRAASGDPALLGLVSVRSRHFQSVKLGSQRALQTRAPLKRSHISKNEQLTYFFQISRVGQIAIVHGCRSPVLNSSGIYVLARCSDLLANMAANHGWNVQNRMGLHVTQSYTIFTRSSIIP